MGDGGNRPMGETYGGNLWGKPMGGYRPQRGFIVGDTAPNAVLYEGY